MLSGIGDQAQLRTHGIKTLVHAPEVGQNFQDRRLHGSCIWKPNEHIHDRNSAANAAGFVKSQASFKSSDVELVHIELAREIGDSAAMQDFVNRVVAPGQKLAGQDMDNFVRDGATTHFHQIGTCRMGKDNKAVVDARLRVNSIKNLRIANSSIVPRIASLATMASCVLIGERMVEILTQRG